MRTEAEKRAAVSEALRLGVTEAANRLGIPARTLRRYVAEVRCEDNVLVVGDLHEPFCLPEYRDFVVEQRQRWQCDRVVFIGDVIDNHYSSYHESDPDGMGAGDELDLAIYRLSYWVKAFPKAVVTIGNHDRLVMRKAMTGGISKRWIRQYSEVLEAPGWEFVDEFVLNGVQYIHGEGGTARARAKKDLCSTVQGHLHNQAYVEHFVGRNYAVYGMQVGCGVDRKSYSQAYAKNFAKPAIACGLVLDRGRQPVLCMQEL